MKRFSVIILIFMILLTTISCSNDNTNESNTTTTNSAGIESNIETETSEEQTTEEDESDSLPDNLDFNQAVINIHAFEETNFYAADATGEIVNDALYYRQIAVEERLNVKLNFIPGGVWSSYSTELNKMRTSVAAGDQAYQIIAGYGAYIPALAAEGYLLDLNELEYINLKKPWWSQNIINEMTIGNKLYFATGDIGISTISKSFAFVFNKKLQREYEVPDFYQMVLDGTWTIDKLSEISRTMSGDLNGDGTMDTKDLFGAAFTPYNIMDAFLLGSDIKMTEADSNGFPVFAFEYEKINTIINKLYNLLYNNPEVYAFATEDAPTLFEMFKNDQLLLAPAWIQQIVGRLRDMDTDYGIIPYPKYDESQEKYYAGLQNGIALMCVPMNCDALEEVGAVMEAMASEGYKNVTPMYFETAMKMKYSRDDSSSKMLDIIRNGAYLPFAFIYNQNIGNPYDVARDLISKQNSNVASWYEQNEIKITTSLESFIEAMKDKN